MLRISRADLAEMQGNLNGNQDIVRAAKARGIDLNLLMECGCAYVEMVERQAQEARESAAREQAAAEEARLARSQELDMSDGMEPWNIVHRRGVKK